MAPVSLRDTLKEYLAGQFNEEVVIARINGQLKKAASSEEFNAEELRWLRAHFDKIPNILKSRLACTIFLTVDKQKGAYLRQLCRKLGQGKSMNPNAVNYWLKKFFRVELLQKNRVSKGWGNEVYYYTPKLRYPNLIKFLGSIFAERLVEQQQF